MMVASIITCVAGRIEALQRLLDLAELPWRRVDEHRVVEVVADNPHAVPRATEARAPVPTARCRSAAERPCQTRRPARRRLVERAPAAPVPVLAVELP